MTVVGVKNTTIVKWGIANNTGFGQYEKTNFFNCQMWGKAGEAIKQYLVKGKQIAVTGELEDTSRTGNDGVKHQQWTLTVSKISLLTDAKNSVQEQANAVATGEGDVVF